MLVVSEPQFRVTMPTGNWTKGRLLGDEADNTPFFYAGSTARVRSATNGGSGPRFLRCPARPHSRPGSRSVIC